MQAIGCLGRNVYRTLVTGVVSRQEGSTRSVKTQQEGTKLVTAVCGFPKQKTGYSIDNILKGQIGDDAYFIARHVDDWSSEDSSDSAPVTNASADVIGVADGVGGWRQYGVDPGQFSTSLMHSCERLVHGGCFHSTEPAKLLASAFREMQESKHHVIGSSTACVMMLSHSDAKLYTANIGDSGFLVVRDGEVVHRSQEQQHYFNTPFQLSLPPTEMALDVLSDQPESADRYEFPVEDGDVIMLATDGIFDNVPDSLLVEQMSTLSGCTDASQLQQCANSIAMIARKLSQDVDFLSPFAQNARANGFFMSGGKEDDITVLLATVSFPQS